MSSATGVNTAINALNLKHLHKKPFQSKFDTTFFRKQNLMIQIKIYASESLFAWTAWQILYSGRIQDPLVTTKTTACLI